jgi:predicted RND superfamily exporter protein
MLGRILEEYKISKDLKGAIQIAMTSVGEPIVFTAIAMTAGIILWIFSPLMFQAYMGFFLSIILLLNMLGGLFLVTSFVAVFKPRFVVGSKRNV